MAETLPSKKSNPIGITLMPKLCSFFETQSPICIANFRYLHSNHGCVFDNGEM